MSSLHSKFCRILIKHLYGSKFIIGLTIDQVRKGMEVATRLAFLPAKTKVEQTSYGGVKAEWVCAKNVNEENVILFLHGGGYNTGSPSTHRELAAHISKVSNAKVLLPDYRLAPENTFPAALEDAITSYRWLIDSGYSSSKIAIAGDSAGVGSDEILLDDSMRMAERAKQAGVDLTINIYEGMWHVFHILYRLIPEAKHAVHELGSFIKNHFGR